MNKYFKYLRKDRFVFRVFILSLIFIGLTLIFIIFNYSKLPPLLPIYNQLPWGPNRLAVTSGILIPPTIALIYLIINIFLSAFSYEKYPLIARIFAVTTSLIGLLTFLFVVRTITLIA